MFKRKPKNNKYQSWHGYLLLGVVIVAIILGIFQRYGEPKVGHLPIEVNQFTCEASGGEWDNCGSACRDLEVEACLTVCIDYCYCESENDCPFGSTCSNYIDGIGVCESL